jgi:hypothetical protein
VHVLRDENWPTKVCVFCKRRGKLTLDMYRGDGTYRLDCDYCVHVQDNLRLTAHFEEVPCNPASISPTGTTPARNAGT